MKMLFLCMAASLIPYAVGNCRFPNQMSGFTDSMFDQRRFISKGIKHSFSVDLKAKKVIFRPADNQAEFRYMDLGSKTHHLYHMKSDGTCTKTKLHDKVYFMELDPGKDTLLVTKRVDNFHAFQYYKGKIMSDEPRRGFELINEYYGTKAISRTECHPVFGNYFRTAADTYSTIGFYYTDVSSDIKDPSKLNPDVSKCV